MGQGDSKLVECDVVVVGAGLSGLCAARKLAREGLNVQIVEASSRIGGRMYRHLVKAAGDHVVDIGGQWVGPTQTAFLELIKELGIETFPSFAEKTAVVFNGERVVFEGDANWGIMPEKSKKPPVSQEALDDIDQGWKYLQAIIEKIPDGTHCVTDPELINYDKETMEAWISRYMKTELGRFFFEAMCRSLGSLGPMEPRMHSVLGFCMSQRVSAQSEYPEGMLLHGGAGQIPEILANEIGHQRFHLNSRVDEIQQANGAVTVFCANGKLVLKAKHVIVATPPTISGRIDYKPQLPSSRQQLIQRWPMGTCCKVLASYSRPFWKDEGVGTAIGNNSFVELGADASDPRRNTGVLAAFIVGDKYRKWKNLETDVERRQVVLQDLATLFGKEAMHPVDLRFGDWPSEPYVGGGYGGFPSPGVLSELGGMIDEPHADHIHWAGTEIATRWCGFFDGAIRTGLSAAQDVLDNL